jgi:hypothetical protein
MRRPQMEASMVAANTPSRAVAARSMVDALVMKLAAELVPELVTSALSYSCVAIVARSVGEGLSRERCWLRMRTVGSLRECCIWVHEPCHGW